MVLANSLPAIRSRSGQGLLDRGLQALGEIVGRDRPDQLVGDAPVAADDEGLGNSVHAPFDRRTAVAVDAVGGERIAEAAEKAPRVVGLVLVVDADDADA